MKILITGAAGSVGKTLVNKLLQTQHEVAASDIKPSPFASQNNLTYQQMDITTSEFTDWVKATKPDIIVHLASVLQISKQLNREKAYQIDVVATENLLTTAKQLQVKKLIITTSGAAYGYHPQNQNAQIDENWPTLGNDDYFYSSHKSAVEKLLKQAKLDNANMQQVVFRPGAIIGPDVEGPVVNLFQQKVITGLVGYPGPFNFIWSEDVVDYLIEAIETDIQGTFNVAGTGALSLKEIAQVLNKPYLALPASIVKAALSVLKPLGLIQYGPEQVKFIKYRPVLNNAKLLNEFTHQPRFTSKQALEQYITYLSSKETV
jgi:UDP-glucose 4-epimerase